MHMGCRILQLVSLKTGCGVIATFLCSVIAVIQTAADELLEVDVRRFDLIHTKQSFLNMVLP